MPGEENNNASETQKEEAATSPTPEVAEAPTETELTKEAAAEEDQKASD